MIKVTINNQSINFPTSWEDLTFNQYIQVLGLTNDYAHLLAVLTGLDIDYIKSFKEIKGLDELLAHAKFLNDPPEFKSTYPMIGHYTLPKNFDIKLESLAQFEDMRAAFTKKKEDETLADVTRKYATYIAIYLQKFVDGTYEPSKVADIEAEVMTFPACEVITLGSFFFLKLLNLSTGTKTVYHHTVPNQKKSKQGSKSSQKPSGLTRRLTKYRGK